jgi:hypothetical protein
MPCQNDVYPGEAQQFLEAVLNNPEKLGGLARKAVGGLNPRRRMVAGRRRSRL